MLQEVQTITIRGGGGANKQRWERLNIVYWNVRSLVEDDGCVQTARVRQD